MAVNEYDCVDFVAVGPDGRLALMMVEERSYRGGDVAVLVEDFRQKLNSYVYAARSGYTTQLAREHGLTNPVGVEIILSCQSQPPEIVEQMIAMVNRELTGEGITARWQSWAGEAVGVDVVERALVAEVVEIIEGAWDFALLWVTLVGSAGSAGVQVRRLDGTVDNLQPSDLLLDILTEHKRASYDAASGTWLSGQISIVDPNRYHSQFSTMEIPDWMPAPTADDLHSEFATYGRPADQIRDLERRYGRSRE